MAKTPSELWKNFAPNLKVFYLYMAAFVGMVIAVVNGMILAQTFFEREVFGVEYAYVDDWQCWNETYDNEGNPIEKTEEEKAECKEEAMERAIVNYDNEGRRSYASGLAGLIIGVIVWLPHFAMARKK